MIFTMTRFLFLAVATLSIGACDQLRAGNPPANRTSCLILWQSFESEIRLAQMAREAGDAASAQYHVTGAQMNLDVLLGRACCRFSDTCPAAVMP